MANKIEKIADIWAKSLNPLRNLTARQIESMLSESRRGNDIRLQQCYQLVESSMPIFGICIQKRLSGILARKWDIVPLDESSEAEDQARQIKQMFIESDLLSEDSLTDAMRHLALGTFRGRSYVKPFVENGKLSFKNLENWHVLRINNKEYWNPKADDIFNGPEGLVEIPKSELCYILNEHPVDLPGIMIYLRQMVGETKWAQFIERQGIPQIVITAPEGTQDGAMDAWASRAMQLMNGGSGTLPNGSSVQELTAGRGQDPFSKYCEHQMELISILATGGTLTTIGGSTGLGSNLAEVQNSQFQCLISQDCKKIENTLSNCAVRKCVASMKQKMKCRFKFIEDEEISTIQHLEMAKLLKDLGATIDIQQLKNVVNLPYIKQNEESVWQPQAQES